MSVVLRMLERFDYEDLMEKLIVLNNGARYGQIVFLAGGSGSGKGFAAANFIDSSLFKTSDPDALMLAYQALTQLKGTNPELQNLDLKNPDDVAKLYQAGKDKNLQYNTLNNIMQVADMDGAAQRGTLPNLIIDSTLKNFQKIVGYTQLFQEIGYKPENMHLIWVLNDYRIAIKQNAARSRTVPSDILMSSHGSVAYNMKDLVNNGNIPQGLNGQISVILNNPDQTIYYDRPDGTQTQTIKDFTYLTIKKPGQGLTSDEEVRQRLADWIDANAPPTSN